MPQKLAKTKQVYNSEHHLQSVCIAWFDLQYPQHYFNLYAIPNGGLRNKIVAKNLKKEGVRSGVWDLHLNLPRGKYNGLYIESKNGKKGLTENQKTFRAFNAKYFDFKIVRSLDQFIEVIQNYLSMEEV